MCWVMLADGGSGLTLFKICWPRLNTMCWVMLTDGGLGLTLFEICWTLLDSFEHYVG
jgi:hypothetical protein